ncbi:MAG: hypothetical protein Tsb0033_12000 [Winogradskyella sp.]
MVFILGNKAITNEIWIRYRQSKTSNQDNKVQLLFSFLVISGILLSLLKLASVNMITAKKKSAILIADFQNLYKNNY